METALIIAVIILPTAFYFLGAYVQRSGDLATIELYKTEIDRLTEANQSLIGSLYHRIGYAPKQAAVPSSIPFEQTIPGEEQPEERKPHGLPDIFKRREQAFADELESEREKARRAQAG